jgi:hypothetical protein
MTRVCACPTTPFTVAYSPSTRSAEERAKDLGPDKWSLLENILSDPIPDDPVPPRPSPGKSRYRTKGLSRLHISDSALSLTTPAITRVFSLAYYRIRAHLSIGARAASSFAVSVHLCHPNLLSRLRSSTWCCPPIISSITIDHDE